MTISELEKIQCGLGMISMKSDECNLADVGRRSVILIDHARTLKDNSTITHEDYLKTINALKEYIENANKRCICKIR